MLAGDNLSYFINYSGTAFERHVWRHVQPDLSFHLPHASILQNAYAYYVNRSDWKFSRVYSQGVIVTTVQRWLLLFFAHTKCVQECEQRSVNYDFI